MRSRLNNGARERGTFELIADAKSKRDCIEIVSDIYSIRSGLIEPRSLGIPSGFQRKDTTPFMFVDKSLFIVSDLGIERPVDAESREKVQLLVEGRRPCPDPGTGSIAVI